MNSFIFCAWTLSQRTIREAEAAAVIVLTLFLLIAIISMFTDKSEQVSVALEPEDRPPDA